MQKYGLKAAIFGLIAGNTVGFIINYVCLRKDLGVIFSRRTINVLIIGLVSITLAVYLMHVTFIAKASILIGLSGILFMLLSKNEQLAVQTTFKNQISKVFKKNK